MGLEVIVVSIAILILFVAPFVNPVEAKTVVTIPQGSASNTSSSGYAPNAITVVIGVNNTVIWSNDDSAPHTVTADTSGIFDSGNLNTSQTFTFEFTKPGTYPYHCTYHSWMHGTVNVKGGTVVPEFPVGSLPLILLAALIIGGIGVTGFRKTLWSHPASVFERAVKSVKSKRSGALPRALAMLSNTDRFPTRETSAKQRGT